VLARTPNPIQRPPQTRPALLHHTPTPKCLLPTTHQPPRPHFHHHQAHFLHHNNSHPSSSPLPPHSTTAPLPPFPHPSCLSFSHPLYSKARCNRSLLVNALCDPPSFCPFAPACPPAPRKQRTPLLDLLVDARTPLHPILINSNNTPTVPPTLRLSQSLSRGLLVFHHRFSTIFALLGSLSCCRSSPLKNVSWFSSRHPASLPVTIPDHISPPVQSPVLSPLHHPSLPCKVDALLLTVTSFFPLETASR